MLSAAYGQGNVEICVLNHTLLLLSRLKLAFFARIRNLFLKCLRDRYSCTFRISFAVILFAVEYLTK
jgi:hypothetical protein